MKLPDFYYRLAIIKEYLADTHKTLMKPDTHILHEVLQNGGYHNSIPG